MNRWMIRLEGGGPLDGFPIVANGRPDELHLPFTDEMVRLTDTKMSADLVDVATRPDARQLIAARGVAVYVSQDRQPAEPPDEDLPPFIPRIATYMFREMLTPAQYVQRYGAAERGT